MGEQTQRSNTLTLGLCTVLSVITIGFEYVYTPWHAFRLPLSVATIVIFLFFTATLLLLRGSREFTSNLRRALLLYFVGYALFGLTQLISPLLNAIMSFSHWWVVFLLLAPTFIASMWILLIGTYALQKVFTVTIGATPWWIETPPPIVCGVLLGLLPHPNVVMPTLAYIILDMFLLWNAHILLLSAYSLLIRLKRMTGVLYTEALAWMVLAVGAMSIAAYCYCIGVAIVGNRQGIVLPSIVLGLLLIAGLCLLRSSYAFQHITSKVDIIEPSVARDFFGKPLVSQAEHAISSIDIVIYTANLVSIPSAIDAALDKMRVITSRAGNTQGLSLEDQQTLLRLYLEIEEYLIHKEVSREFTKESLREEIARKLHLTTTTASETFWAQLPE